MDKRQVIVTGGMGYIGSHTVVELIEGGFQPIIVDDLSNSSNDVLDGLAKITGQHIDFHQIDICNQAALFDALKGYKRISGIIHFAALKAVGESTRDPIKYYRNNLVGMLNVLDIQMVRNIPNLIFSSSCTVYGQPEKLPVTEDSPLQKAESPYGNTKKICEDMIADTVRSNPKLRAISLRYFNPVGAHPSALIGELPLGVPENLVPYITQTAAGIRDELKIFGDDYPTPDGTCLRDYIHVVDLAKAHIAMAATPG